MALVDQINEPNFGLFSSESTSIDAIAGIVDLYPEESHNLPVTKTKYPVESDGNNQRMRSDNFVVEDEQLVLKGLVSDLQPFLGGIVNVSSPDRSKEAWGRIRELKNSGTIVTVITILGTYENMMVTGVDASVSERTGRALFFTITLEETKFSETETTKLAPQKLNEPAETKGSDADGGLKQSETTDAETTTLLQDVISTVSGFYEDVQGVFTP